MLVSSLRRFFSAHVSAPRVRALAPAFSGPAVVNGQFKDVSSKELFKGKYGVLLFYPLDFTFVSMPTTRSSFHVAMAAVVSLFIRQRSGTNLGLLLMRSLSRESFCG